MKIKNLDVTKYKRFFAFGCSFTSYKWMTWADIIGNDIEYYENWAEKSAGNHFIFNSVIEADTRYNFNEDDLVMVFWTTKQREDRYLENRWIHATPASVESTYSKDWIKKFFLDQRSFLIRDLGYIKATQQVLNSKNCDWSNLCWCEFFDCEALSKTYRLSNNKESLLAEWQRLSKEVFNGKPIPELFDNRDVIKLYQDVFTNIHGVYRWFENEYIKNRSAPDNDLHPIPTEALHFLDVIFPDNNISELTRNIVKTQDLYTDLNRPIVKRL